MRFIRRKRHPDANWRYSNKAHYFNRNLIHDTASYLTRFTVWSLRDGSNSQFFVPASDLSTLVVPLKVHVPGRVTVVNTSVDCCLPPTNTASISELSCTWSRDYCGSCETFFAYFEVVTPQQTQPWYEQTIQKTGKKNDEKLKNDLKEKRRISTIVQLVEKFEVNCRDVEANRIKKRNPFLVRRLDHSSFRNKRCRFVEKKRPKISGSIGHVNVNHRYNWPKVEFLEGRQPRGGAVCHAAASGPVVAGPVSNACQTKSNRSATSTEITDYRYECRTKFTVSLHKSLIRDLK